MSDNPVKCSDYLKIIRLLVDVGTELVRNVFYHFKPKDDVKRFFESTTIQDEIYILRKKHVLSKHQFSTLNINPDPENFDISLLVVVLTNLFKINIEQPTNGWDAEIDENDTSLGADLLRLQLIRNSLVGHRPNARIQSDAFEKLWAMTEAVFLNIANFLGSGTEFQMKINEYKTAKLEPNNDVEIKYLDLMQLWYDEGKCVLTDLQSKMERYLKKAEEFEVFFKNVPERYWRYVLLLYEGGMTVMAALLKKLLIAQRISFVQILNEKKEDILKMPSVAIHIYLDTEINTDVTKWGLTTFARFIQIAFASQLDSLDAVTLDDIRKAAESYADIALDSLDSDKFRSHWTDITTSLNTLAIGLDRETQLACLRLIKTHDKGAVDIESAKTYISYLQRDCHPFQNMLALYFDTKEKLKQILQQMKNEGICFDKAQVVELKMMTFGEPEEKKKLAEDILYTVWNEAVTMTGNNKSFPGIKLAVDYILKGIRGIKGVEISTPERHCILVKILCQTCSGLLELLTLLDDQRCWENLGFELSSLDQQTTVVTGFLTIESMELVAYMSKAAEKRHSRTVSLNLACSSELAVNNLQTFLENDLTTTIVDHIAKKLSTNVDGSISVKLNLNRLAADDVCEETTRLLGSEGSCVDVAKRISEGPNISHLRKTLLDISTVNTSASILPGTSSTAEDLIQNRRGRKRTLSCSSLESMSRQNVFDSLNPTDFNFCDSSVYIWQYVLLFHRYSYLGNSMLRHYVLGINRMSYFCKTMIEVVNLKFPESNVFTNLYALFPENDVENSDSSFVSEWVLSTSRRQRSVGIVLVPMRSRSPSTSINIPSSCGSFNSDWCGSSSSLASVASFAG